MSERRKGWRGRHQISDEERVSRYVRVDQSGCWLWTGPLTDQGYGVLWSNQKPRARKAHRVVFEMHRGPIPEGKELDHLCRNRACVNPAHLDPVNHRENLRRSPLMGRAPGSLAALQRRHAA